MGLQSSSIKHGHSLVDTANEPDDTNRVIFSEYHAMGAMSGAFMIRKGRYKYVHYSGLQPQLFNLEEDPQELVDIAYRASSVEILSELETELRKICSPEEVDARAKADQAALVERHGGREAVVARGSFGGTPAPGEQANFG
jgi:choline-sulfatase